MNEYITKDQVIELLHYNNDEKCAAIIADVEELEPADVEEVVQCKDCDYAEFYEPLDYGALYKCQFWDGEHYGEHPTVGGDDFCSYGVRKS